jgi:hypothetical protein
MRSANTPTPAWIMAAAMRLTWLILERYGATVERPLRQDEIEDIIRDAYTNPPGGPEAPNGR